MAVAGILLFPFPTPYTNKPNKKRDRASHGLCAVSLLEKEEKEACSSLPYGQTEYR